MDGRENLKMVLLGDVFVGKTSLSNRFVTNEFSSNVESTVRIAFQAKNVDFEGEKLTLRLWDTAGQEKYRSLAPIYYKGADAAIIIYDVTRADTLETVSYWMEELKKENPENHDLAIAVDVEEKEREVSWDKGEMIAKSAGALFGESSARTGEGVESIFIRVARDGWEKKKLRRQAGKEGSINLQDQNDPKDGDGCNC